MYAAQPARGSTRTPKPAKIAKRSKFTSNFQEAAITFTLGYLEKWELAYDSDENPSSASLTVTKVPRLEQHSTVNGYHVRTIPGKRWTNPVIVAAGGGRLAIVDRSVERDTIRVTDKYGGADPQYSEDHLAYPDFDWASIADDFTLQMPVDYRVTALQITDRDVLIAGLSTDLQWNGDRTTRLYTYDFQGYGPWGNIASPAESDLLELPSECWNGPIAGRPSLINNGLAADRLLIALAASDPIYAGLVFLYDINSRRIPFGRSLPSGQHAVAVCCSHNAINIICRSERQLSPGEDPYEKEDPVGLVAAFRTHLADAYHTFSFPRFGPDGDVTKTFDSRDIAPLKDIRITKENGLVAPAGETVKSLDIYAESITSRRTLPAGSTSYTQNLGRVPEAVLLPSRELPASLEPHSKNFLFQQVRYPVDNTRVFIDADCSNNQTVEFYRERLSPTEIDDTKPVFRAHHGSHFDWLSEGGYTYKTAE